PPAHASRWALAPVQGAVAYPAGHAGSMAVKVDADTRPARPARGGGHRAEDNRPEKGWVFSCRGAPGPACGLRLRTAPADLLAASNVALRTLLARQDWVRTGVVSERPDVSDADANAVQWRRPAESRWRSDTSPRP